jgi:hypothetical protein
MNVISQKKILKKGRYRPPNTLNGTPQTDLRMVQVQQTLCEIYQSNSEDEMACTNRI